MEWDLFNISNDGQVTIDDGSQLTIRLWVAYENANGTYVIALYDGKHFNPVPDAFSIELTFKGVSPLSRTVYNVSNTAVPTGESDCNKIEYVPVPWYMIW